MAFSSQIAKGMSYAIDLKSLRMSGEGGGAPAPQSPVPRPPRGTLARSRRPSPRGCNCKAILCELSFGERYTASRLRYRVRSP
jgi:hypothetical protein